MKKIIALMLCLLIMLSAAACGSSAEAGESAPQTETTAPTTEATQPETTEPTETVTEEATQPTQTEPEAAFDTSWAANDFEKLIPQPPFADWESGVQSSNLYLMSNMYADEAEWAAYKDVLIAAGFDLEDVDRGYKGFDAMGNYFEFMCTGNQALIVIESVEPLGE